MVAPGRQDGRRSSRWSRTSKGSSSSPVSRSTASTATPCGGRETRLHAGADQLVLVGTGLRARDDTGEWVLDWLLGAFQLPLGPPLPLLLLLLPARQLPLPLLECAAASVCHIGRMITAQARQRQTRRVGLAETGRGRGRGSWHTSPRTSSAG